MDIEIKESQTPSEEEYLREAEAWGFDTVEEFCNFMNEEYERLEESVLPR